MKIFWINHRDPKHPQAGGAEVHLREVSKRLVSMGHEVTLLSEWFSGSGNEDNIDGVHVKRIGNMYMIHLMAPLLVRKMAKECDVIIDDMAHAVPWYSTLATEKPVVGVVHHVHQTVAPLEFNLPLGIAVKTAEKTIKYFYENIIAVSRATKDDLINLIGVSENKVRVIYYGVDHETYNARGEKFEEPTILWLGRIKKYKNLDHLITAFNVVKKKLPHARLIIAGTGDYEQKVRNLVLRLGVKDVTFTGWVSGERKVELLRKSWVLAMTSVIEGWGMSILEAASCATPAVGYDIGAIKEAIIDEKTGFLVRYGCIEDLADKLRRVLTDDVRNQLAKGALEYSYKFDWNKTADETLRTISEAIITHKTS